MEFRHSVKSPDLKKEITDFIKSVGGTISHKGPFSSLIAFYYDEVFLYIKLAELGGVTKSVAHSSIFKVIDGDLVFTKSDLDKLSAKNSDEKSRVKRLRHTIESKIEFLKLWLESQDPTAKASTVFGGVSVLIELSKTKDYTFTLRLNLDTTRQSFLDVSIPDLLYTGTLLFSRIVPSVVRTTSRTDEKPFTVKKTFAEWKQFEYEHIKKSIDEVFDKINPELEKRVSEVASLRSRIQKLELEISELNFSVATVVDKNIKLLK